jgi:hypothetical protein
MPQTDPQPPQFDASVLVFTSHPSPGLPLQSARPPSHEAITHASEPQVPVAEGGSQALPQLPQLLSVSRRVSHPSS